jgi:hypothetical protein
MNELNHDIERVKKEIDFNTNLGNSFAYLYERELRSTDWSELISWFKNLGYRVEVDDYGSWKVLKILW